MLSRRHNGHHRLRIFLLLLIKYTTHGFTPWQTSQRVKQSAEPQFKPLISTSRKQVKPSDRSQRQAAAAPGTSKLVLPSNRKASRFETVDKSENLEQVLAKPAFSSTIFTKERSMTEMAGLSIVGAAFAIGVVYTLANNMGPDIMDPSGNKFLVAQEFEGVGYNIVDAAFPTTATEVVSSALGEATAGIVAAFSSFFLSIVVNQMIGKRLWEDKTAVKDDASTSTNLNDRMVLIQKQQDELESRDLRRRSTRDGDFFLAQAAAVPLLEFVGIPSFMSILGSVLFATIPAELVSVADQQRIETDRRRLEMMLDQEETARKSLEKPFPFNLVFPTSAETVLASLRDQQQTTIEPSPPEQSKAMSKKGIEETIFVDVVADIIKWLGYGVLVEYFSGSLTYNGLPLFPGLESAWFGVIAALSAQIYADVFLAVFAFGGGEKQQQILSRSVGSWASTYLEKAVSAACLFGVYEFAQIPLKAVLSAVLSGGAENCYGSMDYNLCVEAYLVNNPPGASPEAQLRSLVTTIASLWNNYAPASFDTVVLSF